MNLDFSDAFSFWKKCGDQNKENGSGARVDDEGSAKRDGLDEVAICEDRCKDGEAGHSDRQSGHQAAKLLQNNELRELSELRWDSNLYGNKFPGKEPRDGTRTTGKGNQVDANASHAAKGKNVLVKVLPEEK